MAGAGNFCTSLLYSKKNLKINDCTSYINLEKLHHLKHFCIFFISKKTCKVVKQYTEIYGK